MTLVKNSNKNNNNNNNDNRDPSLFAREVDELLIAGIQNITKAVNDELGAEFDDATHRMKCANIVNTGENGPSNTSQGPPR